MVENASVSLIKDIDRYTVSMSRYTLLCAYLHFSGRKLLAVVFSGRED